MKIDFRPIDAVKLCPGNPRADDTAVTVVAWLIRDFDIRNPILLDTEGVVIAGHARLAAARNLGMAEVPVIVCDTLPPEQATAHRLADSQTTALAAFLEELLFREQVRRMLA